MTKRGINKTNKNAEYIPVVFITDDTYVIPTAVSIQSLIDNKYKNTKYNVFIISTCLSTKNIELFNQFNSKTVKITIIQENISELMGLHKYDVSGICQATPSALLKFKIPLILKKYNKAIYLDGDILVKKDLSKLFNIELEDNYVAAAHDTGKIYSQKNIFKQIPKYFNSGVMLLNLKKCRSKNMSKKLIKLKKKSTDMSLMDQNILNIAFQKNIKIIDIKYNFLTINLHRAIDKFNIADINNLFDSNYKSLKDIENNAYILHFSSKDKPWKYINGPYSKEWFKYFKKSPYKNEHIERIKFSTLSNNANKEQIIISLTSYPARIKTVNQTIKTLLNQTLKADKVILWLAPEQFPNREKDLPKKLLNLRTKGLTIDWYHDIKSYKKLIPALQQYPDAIIVTVDDDALYDKDMLKNLYESYLSEPKSIHCHRAHKVTMCNNTIDKYKNFIWFNKIQQNEPSSFKMFFTGVGGVLYPPHCLHKNVLNESEFMSLCPHGDDIWFWTNALLNDTKTKMISNRFNPKLIDGSQETALWKNNVYGNENDEQLANIVKKYPQILKLLSDKKEKHKLIKIYLLFPYYLLATILMKCILIPIIKFKKHIKSVLRSRTHHGKMDMLNTNFKKIVQMIQSVQQQIDFVKNQQNELIESLRKSVKERKE